MGGTSGHVSLGLAFLIIGLWHLFNCIKLHTLNPKSFSTLPWFPLSKKLRHVEPFTIMCVTLIFVAMELFVGRTPISPDGSIPSKTIPHLEHSVIALSFFIYALFAVILDWHGPPGPARNGLVHFLQAVAFGQQLLILHLHSTDHAGVEGQYHWLLQTVTFVLLVATLLAIGYPGSFVNSFVRSFSVIFAGVWMIVTGVMLWTPGLMPKGCYLKPKPGSGRVEIECRGDWALDRAKSLVNIQFGLYLIGLTVFSMSLYLAMIRFYPREGAEYRPLTTEIEEGDEVDCSFGAQHKSKSRSNSLPI